MKTQLDGLGMWIWIVGNCSNGNLNTITKNCVDAGVKWVTIKSGDSDRNGQFSTSNAKNIIKAFHDNGIKIGSWNYSVPSTIDRQVSQITSCFNDGVDFHILDPEIEFQQDLGANDHAEQLMQKLRSNIGDNYLAYAPFAIPQYHKMYPYKAFNKYADSVMGQLYWCEFGIDIDKAINLHDQGWAEFNQQNPDVVCKLAPIGNTYGKGLGTVPGEFHINDMVKFINQYKDLPLSLYTYDAAFPGVFDALKKIKNGEPVNIATSTSVISIPQVAPVNNTNTHTQSPQPQVQQNDTIKNIESTIELVTNPIVHEKNTNQNTEQNKSIAQTIQSLFSVTNSIIFKILKLFFKI